MFYAESDLAALVYEAYQDPDAVLRDFAAGLKNSGARVAGLVQEGHCADASLSAVLLPGGEKIRLALDPDPAASGCRLDARRLQSAGARVAEALEIGVDLLIINRFGERERNGQGLGYLIERALETESPVVVAVSSRRFDDWIKFAGGMSVKLACNRPALEAWWGRVSQRSAAMTHDSRPTVCEVLK